MALPTLHGVGRLTADPELRFAASGTAVATMNLAFNSKRKNDRGEWEDDKTFFVRATAFRQLAENIAETLTKGAEVTVSGRLETNQWEDKQTGDKRSAPAMLLDSIGPNLRSATARVEKASRSTSAGESADPWGSAPPASAQTDEPPF